MAYFDELKAAMDRLAEKPDTLFIGQAVGVSGTFMYNTLGGVPAKKRLEFPVAESFQMQFSLGLSLAGIVPITIFPRQNFLALAVGDIVNMVDKIPDVSSGQAQHRMIIRTAVGPDEPVHPGHQHIGDFTEAFQKLTKNIRIRRLDEPGEIQPAYEEAYCWNGTTLLIEVGNFYNRK